MDSNIVSAFIGGIFGLISSVLSRDEPINSEILKSGGIVGGVTFAIIIIVLIIWRKIKSNKQKIGLTIEQFFIPSSESNALEVFRQYLPEATEIRLCGRSLANIIIVNKTDLCDFVRRGGILKILLLDSASPTVDELDSVLSYGDVIERKRNRFPPVVLAQITRNQLANNIIILEQNNLLQLNSINESQTLNLCKTLLPFSMIMLKKRDGSGWASISLYPLHPDIPAPKRHTFALSDNTSTLWQDLEQQFDLAWEDPSLSKPYINP